MLEVRARNDQRKKGLRLLDMQNLVVGEGLKMREILFRGKRLDNGEWTQGFYKASPTGNHYITRVGPMGCAHPDKVDPATVGQYTGLKEQNSRKIFEGDIVDCWSEGVNAKGTVQQRNDGLWIIYPAWQKTIMWGLCPDQYCHTTVEVIGNIHDNPDLIERSESE